MTPYTLALKFPGDVQLLHQQAQIPGLWLRQRDAHTALIGECAE